MRVAAFFLLLNPAASRVFATRSQATVTIQQIKAAFHKAPVASDVRERFLKLGLAPTGGSDADLQAIKKRDTERWALWSKPQDSEPIDVQQQHGASVVLRTPGDIHGQPEIARRTAGGNAGARLLRHTP